MHRFDREAEYLIHLTASALQHSKPKLPDEELDFAVLSTLIHAHRIGVILYPVLQKLTHVFPQEFLEGVRQDFLKAQLRNATQEDALEDLIQSLTDRKIHFMPLKGAILKRYFEKSYQRVMGDIDILIYPENRDQVREIMEDAGYTTELFGDLYDDVYYRKPILNFEVHHALGKEEHFPIPYFDEVWERSLTMADNPYHHEMSAEDFYIYFIVHMAKHCRGHGTGIRSVIDLWVLRSSPAAEFDREKVDAVLSEFGLLQFEKEFILLSEVWFDGKPGDSFQGEMMREFLVIESGLYGNIRNVFYGATIDVGKQDVHQNKRRVFMRRVFPPYKLMAKKYPILKTKRLLLPFFWIYRDILVLLHPKKLKGELSLYSMVSHEMNAQKSIRQRLGFTALSSAEAGEKK